MAIELVIGTVGSGKSYYAAWRLWNEIKKIYLAEINGEDYKYKRIYTNIEGIQPNKYVKILKVEDLHNIWKWEVEQYLKFEEGIKEVELPDLDFKQTITEKKEDELVIRKPFKRDNIKVYDNESDEIFDFIKLPEEEETAYIHLTRPYFEKKSYTDCLFIIDEAHNHFARLTKAKHRLISYHRHYDQDYILIAQDLKQFARPVTALAQKTIKATNPTLKVRKMFVYKVYSGGYISYNDSNRLETIKLKASDDIFRLYISGSVKAQKSYILKKILPIILMFLSAMAIGIYLISNLSSEFSPKPKAKKIKASSIIKKSRPEKKIKLEDILKKPKTAQKAKKIPATSIIKNNHYKNITAIQYGNYVIYEGKKFHKLEWQAYSKNIGAKLISKKNNLDSSITLNYRIIDVK